MRTNGALKGYDTESLEKFVLHAWSTSSDLPVLPQPSVTPTVRHASARERRYYALLVNAVKPSAASEFETVKARLMNLIEPHEDYDEEFLRPSAQAFAKAYDLIHEVDRKLLALPFPKAMVAPDGEGGIRFTWRGKRKDVLLVIYADGTARLHRALNSKYKAEAATVESLAEALKWFTQT
jgi:hypothetical protein